MAVPEDVKRPGDAPDASKDQPEGEIPPLIATDDGTTIKVEDLVRWRRGRKRTNKTRCQLPALRKQ